MNVAVPAFEVVFECETEQTPTIGPPDHHSDENRAVQTDLIYSFAFA